MLTYVCFKTKFEVIRLQRDTKSSSIKVDLVHSLSMRDASVGTATRLRAGQSASRDSIPGWGKRLIASLQPPTQQAMATLLSCVREFPSSNPNWTPFILAGLSSFLLVPSGKFRDSISN
jgi:hypothetical protein